LENGMDFATIHATVWAILAAIIFLEKKHTRGAITEKAFFAGAMILWPVLLPIIILFAIINRNKEKG
jgi:hypothetical protein